MADDVQSEIACFGIVSSRAFVCQPERNGGAERAIRTLKEQLPWLRHEYKTPDQIRSEQKAF